MSASIFGSRKGNYFAFGGPERGRLLLDLRKPDSQIFNNFSNVYEAEGNPQIFQPTKQNTNTNTQMHKIYITNISYQNSQRTSPKYSLSHPSRTFPSNTPEISQKYLEENMHPRISESLGSSNVIFDQPLIFEQIKTSILRDHLKEKILISTSNECLYRRRGLNAVEVIDWTGACIHEITFPGFLLDMTSTEKGFVFLGFHNKGNYTMRLTERQIGNIEYIYHSEARAIDSDCFFHRIHGMSDNHFLAHSIFDFSIQKL